MCRRRCSEEPRGVLAEGQGTIWQDRIPSRSQYQFQRRPDIGSETVYGDHKRTVDQEAHKHGGMGIPLYRVQKTTSLPSITLEKEILFGNFRASYCTMRDCGERCSSHLMQNGRGASILSRLLGYECQPSDLPTLAEAAVELAVIAMQIHAQSSL
jgi:hypothetical protein